MKTDSYHNGSSGYIRMFQRSRRSNLDGKFRLRTFKTRPTEFVQQTLSVLSALSVGKPTENHWDFRTRHWSIRLGPLFVRSLIWLLHAIYILYDYWRCSIMFVNKIALHSYSIFANLFSWRTECLLISDQCSWTLFSFSESILNCPLDIYQTK